MKGIPISDEEYKKIYKEAFSFVDELAEPQKQTERKRPEKKKEKNHEQAC